MRFSLEGLHLGWVLRHNWLLQPPLVHFRHRARIRQMRCSVKSLDIIHETFLRHLRAFFKALGFFVRTQPTPMHSAHFSSLWRSCACRWEHTHGR
jgi:hypothetical protein